MTATARQLSETLRNEGTPHSPAKYDGSGKCFTCRHPQGVCPGVHTFEEIQQAAREEQKWATQPKGTQHQ